MPTFEEVPRVKKVLLVAAGAAAVAASAVRRRQRQSDTETLWREATADASR